VDGVKLNTLDFYIDVSNVCWGIVGVVDRENDPTIITIPKEEWAPGIWAGVKYITLDFKDPETGLAMARADAYEIDMETRTVWLTCNSDLGIIKPGYTIYPRWEYGRQPE